MFEEYRERLINIGIAEKEAAVYVALLHGPATADQTAKRAGLNRSTTYVQIESLMEVGLASTFKQGKKTYFAAESPNNLERLIEMKVQKLEQDKANIAAVIPELQKLYTASGNRPIVRLFEGKEGIITLRNRILESKQKDIYVVTDIDRFQKMYTPKELAAYSKERARRKLRTHVLYCAEDTTPSLTAVAPQKLKRISHFDCPFENDVYIFDNYVAFASYGTYAHGVLLEGANIATTIRSLVQQVWQHAPAYEPSS